MFKYNLWNRKSTLEPHLPIPFNGYRQLYDFSWFKWKASVWILLPHVSKISLKLRNVRFIKTPPFRCLAENWTKTLLCLWKLDKSLPEIDLIYILNPERGCFVDGQLLPNNSPESRGPIGNTMKRVEGLLRVVLRHSGGPFRSIASRSHLLLMV